MTRCLTVSCGNSRSVSPLAESPSLLRSVAFPRTTFPTVVFSELADIGMMALLTAPIVDFRGQLVQLPQIGTTSLACLWPR